MLQMLSKWFRHTYSNNHLQILPALTCPTHFIRESSQILLAPCMHTEKLNISEEHSLMFLYILHSKKGIYVYNYMLIFATKTLACTSLRKSRALSFLFFCKEICVIQVKAKNMTQTKGNIQIDVDRCPYLSCLEINWSLKSEWEVLLKSQIF